jgi:hypothetical protein
VLFEFVTATKCLEVQTSPRSQEVPDVLEVQEIPSEEVRIVPE